MSDVDINSNGAPKRKWVQCTGGDARLSSLSVLDDGHCPSVGGILKLGQLVNDVTPSVPLQFWDLPIILVRTKHRFTENICIQDPIFISLPLPNPMSGDSGTEEWAGH